MRPPVPVIVDVVYFKTALGHCTLAWSDKGLTRAWLPETSTAAMTARVRATVGTAVVRRLRPDDAPPSVRKAIDKITRHLDGGRVDLAAVRLDLRHVPEFHAKVYALARAIPIGSTRSYGEMAALAGSPAGARAVGQAMARNPLPLLIPCHRVLASGKKPGGFTATGGLDTKARILAAEGYELEMTPRPRVTKNARGGEAAAFLARDQDLASLVRAMGPYAPELSKRAEPYEALARAIVYQQLTAKAAGTIFGRVEALFPGAKLPPAAELARTTDARLRAAGLSAAKTAALKDLAAKSAAGAVPTRRQIVKMTDEAILAQLTQIRGIGRWTVEMMLMFSLARPDIFPDTDYGVRKGFARVYGLAELPTPKYLATYAERWKPYRSAAAWYFWRALDAGVLPE